MVNRPVLCRDCRWSVEDVTSSWTLNCTHPKVNATDPWFLGSKSRAGSDCKDERENRWWSAPCGMEGKLWEPKS
jgi:hypothetical protein